MPVAMAARVAAAWLLSRSRLRSWVSSLAVRGGIWECWVRRSVISARRVSASAARVARCWWVSDFSKAATWAVARS